MPSTEQVIAQLPAHLRRYVVTQDYDAYTPRDHAVWRHILHRLKSTLQDRAHTSYLRGLKATGIELDRIPRLDEMNQKLARLGWRAVAVRGFIPPAVFTELQSLKVLAIACDIRSHEHVEYTPAPDIVHESAGHAPILADPRYAEYVQRCGVVGFKAIASSEDQAVYEAIRNLSVVKEDPGATEDTIRHAQEQLEAAVASCRYESESTRASRLYWWTAEYGLVGDLASPRIYGAGLLSSLGESVHCLTDAVKKVPLSLACAETQYDITRMQPQLFVARDFDHLFEVLEAFENTLAWKRGGDFGLREALRARTINHVTLADGLTITGRVTQVWDGEPRPGGGTAALAMINGPLMLSREGIAEGDPFFGLALVARGDDTRLPQGAFAVDLPGGLHLEGFRTEGHAVVNLRARMGSQPLDVPTVGYLFITPTLPSVAGGPADPAAWDVHFGALNRSATGDAEARAQARKAESLRPDVAALYDDIRTLREGGFVAVRKMQSLREQVANRPEEWLLQDEFKELLAQHPDA